MSKALHRRVEEVDRKHYSIEHLQLVTLHFDGTIEPRDRGSQKDFKGRLFFAYTGDVVYSKIDVRNGAIGVVPAQMPRVTVSSEYPVYKVAEDVALPSYIRLLFRTIYFRRSINSMISGTSGRKRVQPEQIEAIKVPIPSLPIQHAILKRWEQVQEEMQAARSSLQKVTDDLNTTLYKFYYAPSRRDISRNRSLVVRWNDIIRWDAKSARAAVFRIENPSFVPLEKFIEDATVLIRPWEKPEKDWPVYGVNNKEGVFFSHYQKGKDFNAAYKLIRKDWFFHNPTRSSVGSLGIVPDVTDDALTSPEYQVWRIKEGLIPGYVAVLVNTPFFVNLIQFHRVGAVKQRLYVQNLLEIRVPDISVEDQNRVAKMREGALRKIEELKASVGVVEREIEEMIRGTCPVSLIVGPQEIGA